MPASFVVHIVDDDEAVRQSLAFLLSTAGIPVRVYESATSFLAALASLQSGCLITDVRMPDMTGIELLQRLRAKDIKLPVIVITGHGDIPLAVEAMKSGAVDFIESRLPKKRSCGRCAPPRIAARSSGGDPRRKLRLQAGSHRFPSASGKCLTGSWRGTRTRPSLMTSASVPGPSKFIAPI
jgi:CheY-like chemotaxis protein